MELESAVRELGASMGTGVVIAIPLPPEMAVWAQANQEVMDQIGEAAMQKANELFEEQQ